MKPFNELTAIIGLTVMAGLLRFLGADASLWLDEIITLVNDMRSPLIEILAEYRSANQHVLNSVLGNLSVGFLGESAWTVRLPAIFFGIATVPAFFRLARQVTTRREALFATFLLTISYHHIWFSQNARGYSAMIFFAVVSTFLLLERLDSRRLPRALNWSPFALVSALGMLSLLNYAFVLVGQFLAATLVLAAARRWSSIINLLLPGLLVAGLTVLAYAMMIPEMVSYYTGGGAEMGWQDPWQFALVVFQGLTASLPALAVTAVIAGSVIVMAGGMSYLRRQPLILLIPVLATGANLAALTVLDFGAYPRSFLYVLPFGLLILVRGTFSMGETLQRRLSESTLFRGLEYILPTAIVIGSLTMLPHLYRYPKQDYTGALAYARLQAAPGDAIAAVGYLAYGYRNYYAPDLEFPEDAAALEALQEQRERVWVLYSFSRDMRRHFPGIHHEIETAFRMQRVFPGTLGDGDIYVLSSQE